MSENFLDRGRQHVRPKEQRIEMHRNQEKKAAYGIEVNL